MSYINHQTTEYDEYLGGDGKTELKTQLSQKGKEFIPIKSFKGNLNGNSYEIKNIYENSSTEAGLFGQISSATIENVKVSGNIINTANAGGITARATNSSVRNCYNNVNINSTGSAGGIIGLGANVEVVNCYNYSNVEGQPYGVGGILGYNNQGANGTIRIFNCGNYGNIKNKGGISYSGAGGIIGLFQQNTVNVDIYNCYNAGEITSTVYAGSLDASGGTGESFNIDKFYYLSDYETSRDTNSNFIKLEKDVMKSQEFIDNYLNKNVEEYNLKNKDNTNFVELKLWKMNNETGYPAFEE